MPQEDARTVIITGAERSVGCQIALTLAGLGWVPILIGTNLTELAAVASLVEDMGGNVLVIPGDVWDQRDVANVVQETVHELGRIDALVYATRAQVGCKLRETEINQYEELVQTNMTGLYLFARAMAPAMIHQQHGAIVAIIDQAALRPPKTDILYRTSMFGMRGVMRAITQELVKSGVRCCTVFTASVSEDAEAGTFGPQDVAEAVSYVLTQPEHLWVQELNLRPASRDP